jgi:hypothetical protein
MGTVKQGETSSERVVETAESQLGRHEHGGANRGDCETYQNFYGSFSVGQPWCGCFVGWVWGQVDPAWKALASPSTAIMSTIAQSQKLTCAPCPGAAFVIPGVHTGLLHHDLGGGVWKTIEGNSGDAVGFRQRSLAGTVVYAPPGLADGAISTPPTTTWYFIEDPASKRVYGGWASAAARDQAFAALSKRLGHELRRFRDPAATAAPFFIEDPAETPRFYGGWTSKAARDHALDNLQRKLGRTLRPFSKAKAAAGTGAKADDLGKVD